MHKKPLLLSLTVAAFAACAHATEPPPRETSLAAEACESMCSCSECTDDQLDKCESDLDTIDEAAKKKNCEEELEGYLECVDEDAECVNGSFDETLCAGKAAVLEFCLGGSSACDLAGDGKCDEPEGTGLCAEGTDALDCGSTGCAFTNNGICDEPQGTGLCEAFTDTADCTSQPCLYQNDGICDEPEGSGLCLDGTDPIDCSAPPTCDYTNDGYCDEPEGSGLCPEGSDAADCGSTGNCSTCYEWGFTDATDPLCPSSEPLWNAVMDCICVFDCASQCATACGGGEFDTACDSCVNSACITEMEACANDV
jgi:hypothetical protein